MSEKEFCKLYTNYHGEEIDKLNQLKQANFSGRELFEFCNYISSSLQAEVESRKETIEIQVEQILELRSEVERLKKEKEEISGSLTGSRITVDYLKAEIERLKSSVSSERVRELLKKQRVMCLESYVHVFPETSGMDGEERILNAPEPELSTPEPPIVEEEKKEGTLNK